jgi:hypothetical protein
MPIGQWINLLFIGCAVAGVGAFLYTLAARIAWEIGLHDLRVEAHRLRAEYAKRIAALQGGDVELSDINVDILDDDGKAMDLEEVIEGVEVEPQQRKAA